MSRFVQMPLFRISRLSDKLPSFREQRRITRRHL